MASNIMQSILIFTIALSLVAIAYVFVIPRIQTFLDTQEISAVKTSFEICDAKIVDTGRTGNDNFCSFPVKRGELVVKKEGIYYSISSNGKICDIHDWVELEPHIWSYCPDPNSLTLEWSWPYEEGIEGYSLSGTVGSSQINFEDTISFRTLTTHIEFEVPENLTGRTIYLRRIALLGDKAIVGVSIK